MLGGGVDPAIDDRRESVIASTCTTNRSQSTAEEEEEQEQEEEEEWVKILNCPSAKAKFNNIV